MHAYFRVAPNFGVGMPWWLVPFALLLWLSLAVVYWFAVLVLWLIVQAALGARWCFLSWRAHHPASR